MVSRAPARTGSPQPRHGSKLPAHLARTWPSSILPKPFRHQDAADILALLDHLRIGACKGVGVSAGGNVLRHLATRQPEGIKAMVLVSATTYFPPQARSHHESVCGKPPRRATGSSSPSSF